MFRKSILPKIYKAAEREDGAQAILQQPVAKVASMERIEQTLAAVLLQYA